MQLAMVYRSIGRAKVLWAVYINYAVIVNGLATINISDPEIPPFSV